MAAFKTWYFYIIYAMIMFIGYYVIDFVKNIPDTFPTATPWSALGWITGVGLAVVGIVISVLISLVLTQSKKNNQQQREDHAENKRMYQDVSRDIKELVKEVRQNFKNDLELRKDYDKLRNEFDDTKEDHGKRISLLEKSISKKK